MQEATGFSVCSMIRIMLYGHPNLSLPYAMKDGEEGRNKDGISKEEAAIMAVESAATAPTEEFVAPGKEETAEAKKTRRNS